MQATGRLAPQPWMADANLGRIFDALRTGGATARFVGGCVRDAVLGRPVSDVDLAVDCPPERTMELLEAAGVKVVPTGIRFGTVTAVVGGRGVEITTLRRDVETDGRRAVVAYTDDWLVDAERRDFTMNAMFADADGALYDAFGGATDALEGRVRFVGDPDARIAEDYLRALRFFRFHAWYGRPPPDAAALAACRRAAGGLRGLSAERVAKELMRLLQANDPAPAVDLMGQCGAFDHWLPEYAGALQLEALVRLERALGAADALRRLMAILDPTLLKPDAFAKRLRLSTQQAVRIAAVFEPPSPPPADEAAVRQAIYREGGVVFVDRLLLGEARRRMRGERVAPLAPLPRALELAATWEPPSPPVMGGDALALGVAPGPQVGRLVAAVEQWWMAQDFAPDRAACLEELRRLVTAQSATP